MKKERLWEDLNNTKLQPGWALWKVAVTSSWRADWVVFQASWCPKNGPRESLRLLLDIVIPPFVLCVKFVFPFLKGFFFLAAVVSCPVLAVRLCAWLQLRQKAVWSRGQWAGRRWWWLSWWPESSARSVSVWWESWGVPAKTEPLSAGPGGCFLTPSTSVKM